MTPAVPLLLLGLVDAAFSGFRAYAGRDARIRKRRANARASLRGLATGSGLLLAPTLAAALLLLAAPDRDGMYDSLTAGGVGYLLPSRSTRPPSCSPSPPTSSCRFAPARSRWSSASAP